MTKSPNRFRLSTWLLAVMLGGFAIATIFAEALTPKTPHFAPELAAPDPAFDPSRSDRAALAAPLRGDLLADIAMARAAPVLNLGKLPALPDLVATRERALAYARQSLALAPHASRMWLLLAVLQSQAQMPDSTAEALKMSYLTAPADVDLIPARLAIVAASTAIADAELKYLARGDIRLILAHRPDLKPAIADAYARGSAVGRAFIDEVVQALDPAFAASLR
jgi:hypothetical protein